ncbi:WD40-repeat-containing domain protein [Parasitella parasitica]|nr:WD40-repeat-containing domain protein [Parasitella parasitica]
MSAGIQKRLRHRRQFGPTRLFDKQVCSDQYIMSHMTLERELPGHTGCVNTLEWSSAGDKLLTGSDDTKLNIYLPFENYEIAATIDTGHRANIFSAKFMPQTSDNIIISGAGDSEIRIFDLANPEKQLDSMYVCHSDQLKKICVYDGNPFEFLTCSQDGTVRHFDRRTPHMCSPHNVRSFITAQSKPARQHPLPECKDLHFGCSNPIVDYGQYNIELNSMSISKLFPHYFAVAGMNDYIYLHDDRMTANGRDFNKSTPSGNKMERLRCIKRFSPTLDGISRPEKHITACKFSDTNGYELLGSWSSDGIFLFNINDDVVHSSIVNNTNRSADDNGNRSRTWPNEASSLSSWTSSSSSSSSSTTPSAAAAAAAVETSLSLDNRTPDLKHAWEGIFLVMEYGFASSAIANFYDDLQKNHPAMDLNGRIGVACVYMMDAHLVCQLRTGRESWFSGTIDDDPESAWSRYFFEYELTKIQQKMEDAEAMLLPTQTWQAYWCLGIGYWALRGGHESIAGHNRKACLDKSLDYVKKALEIFKQAEEAATTSSLSPTATNYSQFDGSYSGMMHLFIIDWQHAAVREGHMSNDEAEIEECGVSCWTWEKLMYITLYSPQEVEEFFMRDMALSSESQTTRVTAASSPSSSSATSSLAIDEDQHMTEDEVSLYTRIMSRQIMDIYRRGGIGDDSEDSDLDLEELAVFRESTQQSVEADVGVVRPRRKYAGHSNIETIKDVDFFGPYGEYVVSGSDGGYLFVWDKKTSKIIQILQADRDIVNVAKGHPTLPILAVSGIDATAKIFTPKSKPHSTLKRKEPNNPSSYSASSHLYEEQEIVALNHQNNQTLGSDIYITRSMIAALSRIGRRHRLRRHNDDSDNEEEEEEREFWLSGRMGDVYDNL